MFQPIDEDNFILFAMKNYENPSCKGFSEFKEDLNRIKYIKRLLIKYKKTTKIKERLILNHIIILGNVYGPLNCSRILFFRIPQSLHSSLKSFLDHLRYTPDHIPEVNLDSIKSDKNILSLLSEIK
jgi:hypothetical protein